MVKNLKFRVVCDLQPKNISDWTGERLYVNHRVVCDANNENPKDEWWAGRHDATAQQPRATPKDSPPPWGRGLR